MWSITPIGAEYLVNTYTLGAQQTFQETPQAVAMNPTNGNYVVVWTSTGQNYAGSSDIYMQMYDAAGVPQGGETLVDTIDTPTNRGYANVAMNSSGNFVVTWSSHTTGNWDIYVQSYNASGVAEGAAIEVSAPVAGYDQEYSSVAVDAGGNFVVTWSGDQTGNWQIYDDVFNASGVSQTGPVQVTSASSNQIFSKVAMDGAGDFVITWVGYQSGSNWNVYAEMFGSNNQPVGSIFQTNTAAADDAFPDVAMDAAGNFTITWSGDQSGTFNVYAQSYLSSGAANGGVFQVGAAIGQPQVYSSVAFAGNGDPIITWSSDNQDGSGYGVYAQQFTPSGTAVGSEFQVNTYTTGDQEYSSVAGAANGNFTIVWTSNGKDGSGYGVYGQNFTAGGISVIAVSPSADSSVYGQGVTFTATVSAAAPMTGTPTGTVTFYDGTTTLGTRPLSGGTAAFTTSDLAAGNDDITVSYSGDTYFDANMSNALVETVTPATLTVAANNASAVYGQAIPTFTDTITGFVNGDNSSVVSGSASLTSTATTGSDVGNYAITAALGSLSAANYTFSFADGTLTIAPAATGITGSASGIGSSLQVTATVTSGYGTPDGNVDVFDTTTNTDLGTITLNGGTGGLTTASLPVGGQTLTLSYLGNSDYLTSSTTLSVNVAGSSGVNLNTNESGASATFPVWLSSAPTAPVTVYLTSGNPAAGESVADDVGFQYGRATIRHRYGTGRLHDDSKPDLSDNRRLDQRGSRL